MTDAFICAYVRTPFGRYAGVLAGLRPDAMAAHVLRAVIDRSGIDPAECDDVILGNANQAGEDNRNVARMASLLAGFPVEVPAQTVNRLCGSSLQALNAAAEAIWSGQGDLFIAGGVESMTRSPVVRSSPRPHTRAARPNRPTARSAGDSRIRSSSRTATPSRSVRPRRTWHDGGTYRARIRTASRS